MRDIQDLEGREEVCGGEEEGGSEGRQKGDRNGIWKARRIMAIEREIGEGGGRAFASYFEEGDRDWRRERCGSREAREGKKGEGGQGESRDGEGEGSGRGEGGGEGKGKGRGRGREGGGQGRGRGREGGGRGREGGRGGEGVGKASGKDRERRLGMGTNL